MKTSALLTPISSIFLFFLSGGQKYWRKEFKEQCSYQLLQCQNY